MIIKNQTTTFTITCTGDGGDCRKSETVANRLKSEALSEFRGLGWEVNMGKAREGFGITRDIQLCPDCMKEACLRQAERMAEYRKENNEGKL